MARMKAKIAVRESTARAPCSGEASEADAGISQKLIVRLGQRLGAEAEDYVQEGCLRFYKQKHAAVRDAPALIARIALNLAVDAHRRRERQKRYIEDLLATHAHVGECGQQFHTVLLKQVIASMPEKQRHVFLLNRFSGLSYPEIAARLGISVKTVESRMSKALAHCVALLRD